MSNDTTTSPAIPNNVMTVGKPPTVEEPLFSIEKLRHWIAAFVVCDFNVDVGPEIEWIYPPTPFSTADLSTICFNAFPERSNSESITGDTSFHFRFRQSSPDVKLGSLNLSGNHDYWYGYCLFRQQRDVTVKRNYGQKSFVLVSQHNFTSLFRDYMLARTLSLLDFGTSAVMIESACAQIANWPAPRIDRQELPFFGSIFDVHIPPHEAFPLQGLVQTQETRPNHPIEIFATEPVGSWTRMLALLPTIPDLYILFERVLLAEPVVILATDPKTCSEFVSLIMDLIRPIPYAGDNRPYVTMHSDFFVQSHGGTSTRHFLIGITNPFILKRLNIPPGKKHGSPSSSTGSRAHIIHLTTNDTTAKHGHFHRSTPHQRDADIPTGIHENDSKAYIARDWDFLKSLETKLKSPPSTTTTATTSAATDVEDLNQTIRRHFAYQTALILAPLNRYLATLMSISTSTNQSEYALFSEADFLASMGKYGTSVTFKGKTQFQRNKVAESFYKKFCRCPSFFSWLQMKVELSSSAPGEKEAEGRVVEDAVAMPGHIREPEQAREKM